MRPAQPPMVVAWRRRSPVAAGGTPSTDGAAGTSGWVAGYGPGGGGGGFANGARFGGGAGGGNGKKAGQGGVIARTSAASAGVGDMGALGVG